MKSPETSRQREWQKAQVSRGLCSIDGERPLYRDERCAYHFLRKYIGRKGAGLPSEPLLRIMANQLRTERNHWRRYWAANKHLLPGE